MRYLFILIFILTSLLAIAATPKYEEAGMTVFENPSDVSNSFLYFFAIILFTIFILIVARWEKLIVAIIYSLTFISIFYILSPFVGVFSVIIAGLIIILLRRPNWIVINVSALLLAAGISSMFGISLEPLPVIILLLILAVYDAVSVYKTKHMITLAESITKIKAPLLFVIPRKDGDAYMGVGDVVIPNILVVSAQKFTNSPEIFSIKISALLTLIGGALGLTFLLILIEKRGGAHPGLPYINLGSVLGFLLSGLLTL